MFNYLWGQNMCSKNSFNHGQENATIMHDSFINKKNIVTGYNLRNLAISSLFK